MLVCPGLMLDIDFGLLNHPLYLFLVTGTAKALHKDIVTSPFLEDADANRTRFVLATVDKHDANLLRVTQITKQFRIISLIYRQ